jgi:hypothetical protein
LLRPASVTRRVVDAALQHPSPRRPQNFVIGRKSLPRTCARRATLGESGLTVALA